jgi:hypothetical protein
MKINKYFFSITFYLLLNSYNCLAQNKPYVFNYNTINYYAPADNFSNSKNKIFYDETEISIDLFKKEIILKTYYSDGPVESIYGLKKLVN